MLRWRLVVGSTLVALLAGLCWLDHRAPVAGLWLLPLLVVFVVLASSEALGLLAKSGARPVKSVVYVGNLSMILGAWGVAVGSQQRTAIAPWNMGGEGAVSIVTALVVLAALAAEMRRYEQPGAVIRDLTAGVFAVAYVGVLSSFLILLRVEWGMLGLTLLVVVVKGSDIGAYTVGRLIGRRKLAPRLSPGKTVEGALGAFAFGVAGAWIAVSQASALPVAGWRWMLFAVVVTAAGMLGDVAESLLKRDAGAKDSSTWLPGMGGVLDILDSLLAAAPVAYALWRVGLLDPL